MEATGATTKRGQRPQRYMTEGARHSCPLCPCPPLKLLREWGEGGSGGSNPEALMGGPPSVASHPGSRSCGATFAHATRFPATHAIPSPSVPFPSLFLFCTTSTNIPSSSPPKSSPLTTVEVGEEVQARAHRHAEQIALPCPDCWWLPPAQPVRSMALTVKAAPDVGAAENIEARHLVSNSAKVVSYNPT